MSTLEHMMRYRIRVRWVCSACIGPTLIALDLDGSLWDRQPPCPGEGCQTLAHFMASPGEGTIFRPLLSYGLTIDEPPPQAWMGA